MKAALVQPVDLNRPGVWTTLFPKALSLMKHLETQTRNALGSSIRV